jgi:hypothetical protein
MAGTLNRILPGNKPTGAGEQTNRGNRKAVAQQSAMQELLG